MTGSGATRPLPRDGGVEEEFHGNLTFGPRLRSGPEIINGSNAEDAFFAMNK